jgi:hypothetical protein
MTRKSNASLDFAGVAAVEKEDTVPNPPNAD